MKWILTSRARPTPGDDVLGYWAPALEGGVWTMDVVTYSGHGSWHDPEDDEDDYCAPTYWMPLPARPDAHSAALQPDTKESK